EQRRNQRQLRIRRVSGEPIVYVRPGDGGGGSAGVSTRRENEGLSMRPVLLLAAGIVIAATLQADAATLAIHGRINATPSVAATNQFVAVAWGATIETGATDVYLAVSRDGGRTFAGAVRVSDERHASLGAEQPPRVALIPRAGDPEVV